MILKNTKEYIKSKKDQGLYGVDFSEVIHPGAALRDELEFFGITQKELANKIGYSIQTVNRIVTEKEPITTDIALALERVFDGRPYAQFWLSMQMDYDSEIAKLEEFEETQKELDFFKLEVKQTFKELQKGGIFENYPLNSENNYKKAILAIKNFFGSYSLESISREMLLGVPFRKYLKRKTNRYNLTAILKIGEKKARKILKENNINPYAKLDFEKKLETLKKLSNKKPKEFLSILQDECLKVGVIVVYVPNMTKTGFGGAAIQIGDHPVILLKVENQWEDIFWFNFFHEAGHILKHSKKEVFIDFEDGKKDKTEIEADDFASKVLIPDFEKVAKEAGNIINDEWFNIVSKKTGAPKNIVAGRVCHIANFQGAWKILDKYRPTIKEKVNFV